MFWYQSKTKEKVVRIDIATVNETKVFIEENYQNQTARNRS